MQVLICMFGLSVDCGKYNNLSDVRSIVSVDIAKACLDTCIISVLLFGLVIS